MYVYIYIYIHNANNNNNKNNNNNNNEANPLQEIMDASGADINVSREAVIGVV